MLSTLRCCLVLGFFLAVVLSLCRSQRPAGGPARRHHPRVPSFLIALAFTFLYGTVGVVDAVDLGAGRDSLVGFLCSPWAWSSREITSARRS
ncbi:hypothetical protein ACU686_22895 [Yinghuangia aomiensis]